MSLRKDFKDNRGQSSLEIIIILLFLIILIVTYLYAKVLEGIERSYDLNDVALARESLEKIREATELVALGGNGTIKDITIHMPIDLVNISCGGGSNSINFTVLLYSQNCSLDRRYAEQGPTTYCYNTLNITTSLPIDRCEICYQETHQRRKGWVDQSGDQLKFCCDAGFNMHLRIIKNATGDGINILQRRYWLAPGPTWSIDYITLGT